MCSCQWPDAWLLQIASRAPWRLHLERACVLVPTRPSPTHLLLRCWKKRMFQRKKSKQLQASHQAVSDSWYFHLATYNTHKMDWRAVRLISYSLQAHREITFLRDRLFTSPSKRSSSSKPITTVAWPTWKWKEISSSRSAILLSRSSRSESIKAATQASNSRYNLIPCYVSKLHGAEQSFFFSLQTHPMMNKDAYSSGILVPKDPQRAFQAGSISPVLKWRLVTKDESQCPLSSMFFIMRSLLAVIWFATLKSFVLAFCFERGSDLRYHRVRAQERHSTQRRFHRHPYPVRIHASSAECDPWLVFFQCWNSSSCRGRRW